MRILHLFSDWKWTGPAEPALRQASELAERGHDVFFACASPPHPVEDSLLQRAREAPVHVLEGLRLEKHFKILADAADVRVLRRRMEEIGIDVVHVHRDQDHLIGGAAARRAGAVIVRTNHTARPFHPLSIRKRLLVHRFCDRLVEVSREALETNRETFGLAETRSAWIETAVDLERFRPGGAEPLREELGLDPRHVVVGIVARVQRHRRFEILFEAFDKSLRQRPELRLLMVGRGTHYDTVARIPIDVLGLNNQVVQAGYRKEDFPGVLACFDMKVFLQPGTDGSCRAVREAMAAGIPVIASRRGMLPELVAEDTGVLVDDAPEALAEAIARLADDRELRKRLGRNARREAERRFDPGRNAEALETLYGEALEEAKRRTAVPATEAPVEPKSAPAPVDPRNEPVLDDMSEVGEWPDMTPQALPPPETGTGTEAVDVSVVVVNWNGRDLLPACLESIQAGRGSLRVETVVVDNGSRDGSAAYVRDAWPDVRRIENPENRGFGAANNQAFRQARGRNVLLLNSDARLEPGTLQVLSDFLDGDANAGAVTPLLVDEAGGRQNAFDNFPTLASELLNKDLLRLLMPGRFPGKRREFPAPVEVESALGACLLLKRKFLERAGGFDEDYFFFLEETDLCYRIRELGGTIHLHPG